MSDTVLFDWLIPGAKSFIVIFMVLNLAAMLLWIERKGSALIQNRVGANRANILGIMPFNFGFVNTLIADPMKLFTKEEFVPEGADRFVHAIAPFLALLPAVVTMVAVPFGDTVELFGRTVELQAVRLDVGVLYISASSTFRRSFRWASTASRSPDGHRTTDGRCSAASAAARR
jgi:NADH-quinone oxidoreductase subunit H